MERPRTLNSYQIIKIKNKKFKTYSGWCPFKGLSNDITLMQIQSGRTVPLIILAALYCKFPVIKGRVKLTTMNVKLLAAIVPYSFKWRILVFLSTFLQLSNGRPTQVCSAPAGRQVISTTLATPQKELRPQFFFWKGWHSPKIKVYRQSLY